MEKDGLASGGRVGRATLSEISGEGIQSVASLNVQNLGPSIVTMRGTVENVLRNDLSNRRNTVVGGITDHESEEFYQYTKLY